MVQWCLFDWQSFATLATGFAAVTGAVAVGLIQARILRRQAEISKEQATILSRQVELEEARLRADLFQRRLETYEATADFLIHLTALPAADDNADERIQRFGVKMRESRFLFSDARVHAALVGFWDKGNAARLDRSISIAESEERLRHDPERTKRLLEYPIWAMGTLETLADIFRRDLTILEGEAGEGLK